MRALALAAALAVAGWLSLVPALATTFRLASGETIEGAIIDATRNTVTIRPRLGGLRQIPVGRLEQLETTTADGQTLRGRYYGWVDGRYGVVVGAELLWLENDRVVARAPLAGPAVAQDDRREPAVPAPAIAPAASWSASAAQTPPPAAAADAAKLSDFPIAALVVPLPPVKPPPEPAARPEAVALPAPDLPVVNVKAAPDEVSERSGEVVFTIELSRPIDDLLVVIYSTVDGTAHSGADYEPLQGILTLPAGVTSQQVRTVVIDDAEAEGDEDFQLFLATNPDLTQVAQQWTKVTIHDDD
jgi:Calx-beta domain